MNAASTGPLPGAIDSARQIDFVAASAACRIALAHDDQFGTLTRCARTRFAARSAPSRVRSRSPPNTGAAGSISRRGDSHSAAATSSSCPIASSRRTCIRGWLPRRRAASTCIVVPLRDGLLDEEALLAALDRPGVRRAVRLVGRVRERFVADLGAARRALSRARRLVRRGRHSGPRRAARIDVKRTPVDLLACGAQKWLLARGARASPTCGARSWSGSRRSR